MVCAATLYGTHFAKHVRINASSADFVAALSAMTCEQLAGYVGETVAARVRAINLTGKTLRDADNSDILLAVGVASSHTITTTHALTAALGNRPLQVREFRQTIIAGTAMANKHSLFISPQRVTNASPRCWRRPHR